MESCKKRMQKGKKLAMTDPSNRRSKERLIEKREKLQASMDEPQGPHIRIPFIFKVILLYSQQITALDDGVMKQDGANVQFMLKHDFYLAVFALPSSRLKHFSGLVITQFLRKKKRYHLEEESDFGITKGDLLEKAIRALDLRIHSVDGNIAKPNTP
ncbi:hypothetical protein Tco_0736360 [Tanacetum coccineum]